MASTLRFDNWENSNGDSIASAVDGFLNVPGSVLQVVNSTYSSEISTTSTTPVSTPLSVSITPKSESSSILILANIPVKVGRTTSNTNTGAGYLEVQINGNKAVESGAFVYAQDTTSTIKNITGQISFSGVHSPSTTNEITYELFAYTNGASGMLFQVFINNTPGSITLMEIAG